MRPQRLVCLCNQVTAQEILAILKAGALTTADVQAFTMAGTGCTRCVREIDALVLHYKSTQKEDPQLRIEFEETKNK